MTRLPVTQDSMTGAAAVDVAKVAGRGTVYITAAKIWFMVSGYAIHFTLPRLLTVEQFGLYQVVIGIVSVINAVVITGTYQTVSKHVSQEEKKADSVKEKALKVQAVIGGVVSLGFFLLAPLISAYLDDLRLVNYFRLASLITLSYSFYAVFTGYFNGQKRFLTQAGLDMTYSTLKLVLIVLFVWLGYGIAGGIGGFALAAASILLISAAVAGQGQRRGEVRIKDLLTFQAYLLPFTLVLNLLQKVDLILVKALSSPDVTVASESAAYYGAAINVANITYQIIISATFVIFPLISEATFADDHERAQRYISNTLRYTLMIMALVATLFSGNASEVLKLIYPRSYEVAAGALSVVAYGMLLFGLLCVLTTIISASGRPGVSLVIGVVTLAACAVLNAALIPRLGLLGAAIGTTVSMFIGTISSGGFLLTKFGSLVRPGSALRIAGCSALVYAASLAFGPSSRVLILGDLLALGVLYFAALIVTREIGRKDLWVLRKVFKD